MAKKKKPEAPTPAHLTAEDMRMGIAKLKRRLGELADFDPDTINGRSDPQPSALEKKDRRYIG